jgi:hypothetical protein
MYLTILPQVPALLVFGSLPLWAQVCTGLPDGPGDTSKFLDKPVTRAYRISVTPGGPAFRVTVYPLLDHNENRPVHAGNIEIARCQDGRRIQILPIQATQPINFAATFVAQDINFDGYTDFSVLSEFAAKYGSRSYWIYDPRSESFVVNGFTRELSENCMGNEWHGGCWKANTIDFDPGRREVSLHYLIGVGQCGGPVDRYRIQDGQLIVVHKEVLERSPEKCTITVSDRTGSTMRVTAVHRFDGNGSPLGSSGH